MVKLQISSPSVSPGCPREVISMSPINLQDQSSPFISFTKATPPRMDRVGLKIALDMDQWQLTAFSFPFGRFGKQRCEPRFSEDDSHCGLWLCLKTAKHFFPVKPQRAAAVIYRIPVPALNLLRPSPVAYAHRIVLLTYFSFALHPALNPQACRPTTVSLDCRR